MKKLILLLTIAVTVVSVKAASIDWSVNATSELEGATVYLLTSAPGDYADLSALAAAAVSQATVVAVSGRNGTSYYTPTTTAGGASVTASADFYYVIVAEDGKSFNYAQATGMGAMVYDPGNQESSKGTFDTVNSAAILAGSSESFGGGDSGNVPEPTSGLLLIVGGALLALRRRQK